MKCKPVRTAESNFAQGGFGKSNAVQNVGSVLTSNEMQPEPFFITAPDRLRRHAVGAALSLTNWVGDGNRKHPETATEGFADARTAISSNVST